MDIVIEPFGDLMDVEIPVVCKKPLLGLEFIECAQRLRPFVSKYLPSSSASKLKKKVRNKLVGAYVVKVNDRSVYTVEQVDSEIADCLKKKHKKVKLVIAPEKKSDNVLREVPLHMQTDRLLHVHALLSTDTNDVSGQPKQASTFRQDVQHLGDHLDQSDVVPDLQTYLKVRRLLLQNDIECKSKDLPLPDDDDALALVCKMLSEHATEEEKSLKSFTRRNLMSLPPDQWATWKAAYKKQLDVFDSDGVFGEPIKPPPGAIIMRPQWANVIKADGTRKSRCCCDGSKRQAPQLHNIASTYSSCIEQPCMRLYFALSSALGYFIRASDTTNAFQTTIIDKVSTYMRIDDAFAEWYEDKFGVKIDRSKVLPIERALQGHPLSGALWERKINNILTGPEFNLRQTTHERNLLVGTFNGEPVLLCKMIDDISISAPTQETCTKLIAHLGKQGIHIRDEGTATKFNGVDILQTRDYVGISCESYLNRMLLSHGWDTPSATESPKPTVPMTQTTRETMQRLPDGPLEGTPDHKALESEMKFCYRNVLGEVLYAYTVGRLDIGFACTTLARHALAPAKEHYIALKHVCKYLRQTKDWKIIYWRQAPRNDFPDVPFAKAIPDPVLPDYPVEHNPFRLTGSLDASHAADVRTRRSVTGIVFTLAGGAIAYKSKQQTSVTCSSTEAEAIACLQAAKMARYFRAILFELGVEQTEPTLLYCDNMSAINMINNDRPTERLRHVQISLFVIQQWQKKDKSILMAHIDGILNNSDQMTKSLGWTLHDRHVRRSMGHFGVPYI